MCDYSLMHLQSRDAKVEDVLQTTAFVGTISYGFSPIGEPEVACCVRPGTEIAFTETIKTRDNPYMIPGEDTGQKLARFRQVNLGNARMHHDALELADGKIVMLNDLVPGQTATILQLPAVPQTADEAKAQERLEVVG